ncbi:hypothetical protein MIB92_16675 [Aestuariirhabdus sp. Z084]|uniref:hypothetical protein n=1 Tax=Aestuariirhabdus haliotis TaxID=2918751 RepID=UPI00201B411F|nr:hypothetical protein [Aestuariirhabdus haliotis]MCL6417296.1 hypothetical protein [Aestuariirhabdus haliotis]MCL6421241.1 hypothetical protein [Aestuariirhabdus haliotis]
MDFESVEDIVLEGARQILEIFRYQMPEASIYFLEGLDKKNVANYFTKLTEDQLDDAKKVAFWKGRVHDDAVVGAAEFIGNLHDLMITVSKKNWNYESLSFNVKHVYVKPDKKINDFFDTDPAFSYTPKRVKFYKFYVVHELMHLLHHQTHVRSFFALDENKSWTPERKELTRKFYEIVWEEGFTDYLTCLACNVDRGIYVPYDWYTRVLQKSITKLWTQDMDYSFGQIIPYAYFWGNTCTPVKGEGDVRRPDLSETLMRDFFDPIVKSLSIHAVGECLAQKEILKSP